jgi:hypothetical protein
MDELSLGLVRKGVTGWGTQQVIPNTLPKIVF